MRVIHIGLGKTATTSLQNSVFSELPEIIPDLQYNPEDLVEACARAHILGENFEFNDLLNKYENLFISSELLVNWDPHMWEYAANKNKEIFGSQSTIIITIRDSVDWLTSLYQQMIQQGWVIEPHEFFIETQEYLGLRESKQLRNLDAFDIDSFNIERLHKIYTSRFKRVFFVHMQDILSMSFLKEIYSLNNSDVIFLSNLFKEAPFENKAFSSSAMRLTFFRERFLKRLNLQSYNSQCGRRKKHLLLDSKKRFNQKEGEFKKNKMFFYFKKVLPAKFKEKIKCFFYWRCFIQNIFDKVTPYRKYSLPKDILERMKSVKRKNDFYALKIRRRTNR